MGKNNNKEFKNKRSSNRSRTNNYGRNNPINSRKNISKYGKKRQVPKYGVKKISPKPKNNNQFSFIKDVGMKKNDNLNFSNEKRKRSGSDFLKLIIKDKKDKDKSKLNNPVRIKFTPFMNLNMSSLMNDLLGKSFDKSKKEEDEEEDETEDFIYKYDPAVSYEEHNYNITSIKDLIDLGKSYKKELTDTYPIDMYKLNRLVEPLEQLEKVVGMDEVKKNIVNNIIYFLQDLDDGENMFHTIITGPPGVGKTMLGYILAKLYYNMGIFKKTKKKYVNPLTGKKENFKFTIARRSDLVGRFLGETAMKTQELIDNALGGVLFIDEAYSLGNQEKRDSFSKECIDTINQNLTENKGKFICIIAGYEEDLERCFFSYNAGLRRRFMFKYNIKKYNYKELADILFRKIEDSSWNLVDTSNKYKKTIYEFFKNKHEHLTNFGGDIELLLLSCKITHSLRIFGKNHDARKKISLEDIVSGFELFKTHKNSGKKKFRHLSMFS